MMKDLVQKNGKFFFQENIKKIKIRISFCQKPVYIVSLQACMTIRQA